MAGARHWNLVQTGGDDEGEIAEFLGVSDSTARKYLARLVSDHGLIERDRGPAGTGLVTVSSNRHREEFREEDLLASDEGVA